MQDSRILAAVDVGTSKVCTIIAMSEGRGAIRVLAHSVVPSDGLKKGNVADVAAAEKAVGASLREAQRRAGIKVESTFVGVTGAHVSFENRRDSMDWAGSHGVVTADDLARVTTDLASSPVESGRQVLHAIPTSYTLDGQQGIRHPLGMHTNQVEVARHVVTGAMSFIEKLTAAVENAGGRVSALVLEPLASSEAVLTPRERQQGAAVVDIGGGTTDLVVFKDSAICYTGVIPIGGYQFTNDICHIYNTAYTDAEKVKIRYAHTDPHVAGASEKVSIPALDHSTELRVSRRDICQLTRERASELARLIRLKLLEAGMAENPNFRLVLTGGTSNLPGLEGLVRRTVTNRVRIGVPDGRGGIPEELRTPAFATSVGILYWAMNQDPLPESQRSTGAVPSVNGHHRGLVSRILYRLKAFLPTYAVSAKQGRS